MRQQAFKLAQAFFDFHPVEGGEVIEGEREEGFHPGDMGKRGVELGIEGEREGFAVRFGIGDRDGFWEWIDS